MAEVIKKEYEKFLETGSRDDAQVILDRPTKDFIYIDATTSVMADDEFRAYMELTMYMAYLQELRVKSKVLIVLACDGKLKVIPQPTFSGFLLSIKKSLYPIKDNFDALKLFCMVNSFYKIRKKFRCIDFLQDQAPGNEKFENLDATLKQMYKNARSLRTLVISGSVALLNSSVGEMHEIDNYIKRLLSRYQ